MAKGWGVSFVDKENVLILILVMVSQLIWLYEKPLDGPLYPDELYFCELYLNHTAMLINISSVSQKSVEFCSRD